MNRESVICIGAALLLASFGNASAGSTRIWLEMDRHEYLQFMPAVVRVWAEGPLPAGDRWAESDVLDLPNSPAFEGGWRGWVLDLLLRTPDSLVVLPGVGPWVLASSREQVSRTSRRVIGEARATIGGWAYPYRNKEREATPWGDQWVYELVRFRSFDEVLAMWPGDIEIRHKRWLNTEGVTWRSLDPSTPLERVWATIGHPGFQRALTEHIGRHELIVVLTARDNRPVLSAPVAFEVVRPAGGDSAAAELFRDPELLEALSYPRLRTSERANGIAESILEGYPESPYGIWCHLIRGMWLYRLAELARDDRIGKVLVDSRKNELRLFTSDDHTAFSEARDALLKVVDHPDEMFGVRQAKIMIGMTYISEGRGEEAAHEFVRFGVGSEALAMLAPDVDHFRQHPPQYPLANSWPEKEAGARACVDELRQQLGDNYVEPDVLWRGAW